MPGFTAGEATWNLVLPTVAFVGGTVLTLSAPGLQQLFAVVWIPWVGFYWIRYARIAYRVRRGDFVNANARPPFNNGRPD